MYITGFRLGVSQMKCKRLILNYLQSYDFAYITFTIRTFVIEVYR